MYTKEIDDFPDEIEDATEYGEFVPTLFVWLTPEEQRRRAEHLGKVISTNDAPTNAKKIPYENVPVMPSQGRWTM